MNPIALDALKVMIDLVNSSTATENKQSADANITSLMKIITGDINDLVTKYADATVVRP